MVPVRLEALSAASLTSGRVMTRGKPIELLPKPYRIVSGICINVIANGYKYRVGGDVNALLLGVLNQRRVEEVWVALNLEGCGHDTGGVDDCLELKRNAC